MISSMCAHSEAFVFLISNFRRAHQTSDHGLEAFDPVAVRVIKGHANLGFCIDVGVRELPHDYDLIHQSSHWEE